MLRADIHNFRRRWSRAYLRPTTLQRYTEVPSLSHVHERTASPILRRSSLLPSSTRIACNLLLFADVLRRRCACEANKNSTSSGTNQPHVIVSPKLAGSSADLNFEPPPPEPKGSDSLSKWLKRTVRSAEKSLSNLQLAIAELAVLAVLSGIGTVIDQEQVTLRSVSVLY